jgi:geranylgeranyl diphosphate synthase type II
MRLEADLAAKKRLVEQGLRRLLSKDDTVLHKAMRYAVLSGGKRFRPLLLLSSGGCFGASQDVLLPFACALELIHNYSLIHDDLPSMDDDDFRRGKSSCHRAFGENIALLAGDALLTLAFEAMAGAIVPPELLPQKQEVIRAISRRAGASGMIGGQVLDVTLDPRKLTRAQVHELILKKTGALIIAAVEAGALLGRAKHSERRLILDYGKNVGLAFQVRDDLLDFEGQRKRKSPLRPDYAAFLGPNKARKWLEELVQRAIASLGGFGRKAGELNYLASSLLILKPEARHG